MGVYYCQSCDRHFDDDEDPCEWTEKFGEICPSCGEEGDISQDEAGKDEGEINYKARGGD